jgi:hypothetical protein
MVIICATCFNIKKNFAYYPQILSAYFYDQLARLIEHFLLYSYERIIAKLLSIREIGGKDRKLCVWKKNIEGIFTGKSLKAFRNSLN